MGLLYDWPETIAAIMMIIGILTAIFSPNKYVIMASAFIAGLIFGRVLLRQKNSSKVPLFISSALFLFGIIIGSRIQYGKELSMLLAIGIITGFYAHNKEIIESVDF